MTRKDTLGSLRRELILEAASTVFAERGYRQTETADILAVVGIQPDTLDPYFADEEACFLGVLDRAVAEVHARAAAAAHGQEGWGRQTYAALRALLGALVADRPVAWIALIEAPNAGAAATARYEELGDAAVAWLCRGRRFYPAAADLPEGFERMVVDGVAFLLRRRLLDPADLAMSALADEIAFYIFEPIVGQAEFRRLESELGHPARN